MGNLSQRNWNVNTKGVFMKNVIAVLLSLTLIGTLAPASEYLCQNSRSDNIELKLDETSMFNLKIDDMFSYFEKGVRVVPVNSRIDCRIFYGPMHSYDEIEIQSTCTDYSLPADGKRYQETLTFNLKDHSLRMSEKRKYKTPEETVKQGYGSRTILCIKK